MEAAVHSGEMAADRDKTENARTGEALIDGASLLSETHRDPVLAAKMFDDYLSGSGKPRELRRLWPICGWRGLRNGWETLTAAGRERAAAEALAQ